MAVLEPRVLELIETLVAARLDWLAFELIEGIRLGRPPDETEEALAAARQSIRGNAQPKARGEPHVLFEESKPILAQEQVEWAAAYVAQRIDSALEQLQSSLETLDFIVDATNERRHQPESGPQKSGKSDQNVTLVLLDPEGDRKSGRDDITGARNDFSALRSALSAWATQVGGQTTT